MDDVTRRRMVFDAAAYYGHLLQVLNESASPTALPTTHVVPWASQRQRLFNRADKAGESLDFGQFMAVLGEFDSFWEEIQRIQASFALAFLAGFGFAGADIDEVLNVAAENVAAMVQAWAEGDSP